jgi:hypothetical protein
MVVGGHLDSWDLADGAGRWSRVVQSMELIFKNVGYNPKKYIKSCIIYE